MIDTHKSSIQVQSLLLMASMNNLKAMELIAYRDSIAIAHRKVVPEAILLAQELLGEGE